MAKSARLGDMSRELLGSSRGHGLARRRWGGRGGGEMVYK